MVEWSSLTHALDEVIAAFLADLAQANRSAHTCRAYATDLQQFAVWHRDILPAVTPAILRDYFATLIHLRPATRARKQAALASLLTWAYRQGWMESNPMGRVARVKSEPPVPRGVERKQMKAMLAVIPPTQPRDQLLFRLLLETGLRIGEALALYIEDVDLTPDDEHLHVLGKGNQYRLILLDDPRLVNNCELT